MLTDKKKKPKTDVSVAQRLHFIFFHSCCAAQQALADLFLVPLEIREEDEADLGVGVLVHQPLALGLLLQDVVDPL